MATYLNKFDKINWSSSQFLLINAQNFRQKVIWKLSISFLIKSSHLFRRYFNEVVDFKSSLFVAHKHRQLNALDDLEITILVIFIWCRLSILKVYFTGWPVWKWWLAEDACRVIRTEWASWSVYLWELVVETWFCLLWIYFESWELLSWLFWHLRISYGKLVLVPLRIFAGIKSWFYQWIHKN